MVLAEVKELEDIRVPRLNVDGKGTGTLVATLVNVSCSVVEDTEHGNDTVADTIGTGNVGASSSDVVDVETDTTSGLGDHGAGLEGVVDTVDRVILHGDKETRRELGVGSTSVEEGGGSVCEELLRHEIVGLDGAFDVLAVDTNSDTHEHVLGTLSNLAVNTEKVGSSRVLKPKKL